MARYSRPPNTSLYVRNVPDGTRLSRDFTRECTRVVLKERKTVQASKRKVTRGQLKQGSTSQVKSLSSSRRLDVRDAEEAMYGLDNTRFLGRQLEIEFAQGDRKTPTQMRGKERSGGSRRRSPYGRRSRSRSPRRRYPRSRSRSYSRSRSNSRDYRHHSRSRSRTRD